LNRDELRSARLLFADELAAGAVTEAELDRPEVRRAVRSRAVPPAPLRLAQRLRMRRGSLSYEADCIEAFAAARRAVLGERAGGAPRLLVRVDEFPHARAYDMPELYGVEGFTRFHETLSRAGVPYLIAITPVVSHDYLDPGRRESRPMSDAERELLLRALSEGATAALHGLDHRTLDARPRHHSEFAGLARGELERRVEEGLRLLAELGVEPRVFVPPFNRFDTAQYEPLAARFDVVCGGPETVASLGYRRTPLWRGEAVYLPSYAPLYARAGTVHEALRRLSPAAAGLWLPVTLHWGWEAEDGWSALECLVDAMAPDAARWEDFLEAVGSSA
jgi:peptidoglycan/xylan/chitin deacetylase (PgdA/CDA1 family)